ncbi:MAG: RNA degradosome polyphosphate kinase [Clostridium sp.]|nr:RNA degradosome polyphosphate kinase [Acetatifactor muris]MCM1527399.1 RNA degradosome polyphosphate kinase [Bacteroides sp.]MCM1563537.1 RNA degradosome polyphosphate kinase [Clostridium sp.]
MKENGKESGKDSGKETKIKFTDPKYYTNRELSWILFDHRVLAEARDKKIPLFERLKFLSITASNLDEFFMIRVASLKDMVNAGYEKKDISGMTPARQLEELDKAIHELVALQYSTYNRTLAPALLQNGLELIRSHEQLNDEEKRFIDAYFEENVYPVLTPMAVDSSRPFPLIRNKTLNIGAMVRGKGKGEELEFATVQVPGVLNRVVELPAKDGKRRVIFLEEIIERNISRLFLNYDIICAHPFRIMRNADLTIDEDEAADLLKEIERQLKKRQRGEAIRLEVEAGIDERLLKFLEKELNIGDENIYYIDGPLDLTVLMKLYGLDGFESLKAPRYEPKVVPELPPGCDIFEAIGKGDILLHHPYQSFAPVVDFIRQAASDPGVLAIKQTLYRVSGNSPIIAALAQAAENGKQVTVLVELKARFDEENNIVWARMLEKAGCHVIYGLLGLKTHSKITLVVRREEDGIRRYVHLGTGNYNDATAKLYTDMGLFTCSEPIGEDATAVFNMLSGYSEPLFWNKLSLAPLWLKDRFLYLIKREQQYAMDGRPARIIAKMNSLCDRDIIAALYEAASKGVRIDLIVRGICCLRTGIPGISENITVRSIVGNFLEHSRIFYFENDEHAEIYCGSADWMPRNLERRVEILFPVEAPALKEELMHILEVQLADTVKASVLQPDGSYRKVDKRGKKAVSAQEQFVKEATAKAKAMIEKSVAKRTFTPVEGQDTNHA